MITNSAYLKVLTITVVLLIASCGNTSSNSTYGVTAVGTIREQGITGYMYGTHILIDDTGHTLYALTSDTINLDNYIDKKVTVKGDLVNGYPVEGGPDYLNVKSIKSSDSTPIKENGGKEQAYNTVKSQIQNSVTAWMVNHNGEQPPYDPTPFNVSVYTFIPVNVIEICSIIGAFLPEVPDGCYGSASQAHTNFYNSSDSRYGGGCINPNVSDGHYIWTMDTNGNVYSICDENRDGVYDATDRVDGFHQDIWP